MRSKPPLNSYLNTKPTLEQGLSRIKIGRAEKFQFENILRQRIIYRDKTNWIKEFYVLKQL
jgi:hypothetical protein